MNTHDEIVFIDSNLTDYQTLLTGISADAEVYVIDGSRDGLQQMLAILTGRTNIDAIHVLGHGNSGALKLGNLTLNNQNIAQYQSQLEQLGQKLTANGDLLFYGCNVAQGKQGHSFVKQIADFTQADVAASDDLTGAGGDWELEAKTGTIDVSAVQATDYRNSLAVTITEGATSGTEDTQQFSGYTISNGFFTGSSSELTGATVSSFSNGYPVVTGIPNNIVPGSYSIKFQIYETALGAGSTKLTITLAVVVNSSAPPPPANTAPSAGTDSSTINEGTTGNVTLSTSNTTTASDPENDTLTFNPATVSYYATPNPSLKGLVNGVANSSYSVTDTGGLTGSGTNNFTWNVIYADDAPTGSVTATGTSRVSQTLTATNTISDIDDGGAGVSKSYQWQYYNTANNTWTDISGAIASTFAPTATEENKLVRVKITAGSPSTIFTSDVRFISPQNVASDPGIITLTGLPAPITIVQPAGNITVTNDTLNPATNTVTLDGPGTGTIVTTLGNGPINVANPQGGVTVINNGTGITTVTGTGSGNTVTPQGTGPIVIETSANPGIVIDDSQPASDLTITNTGAGTVSVTPVGDNGTVKIGGTSTGAIALSNPVGDTTVTNNGTSVVTVNDLLNAKTVTSNGTGAGNVTVSNPSGDVTLKNDTATSMLSTSGVSDGKTVTTTGANSSAVNNPSGNVTVNNTSTGTVTVSGTANGKTVTTQGTGSIVVNSVLTTPDGITIDATANQNNVTVDNDGTGSVSITNLIENGLIKSTGSGAGSTTVTNPAGSFTINNTGTNTVSVTGFDDAKTLTTTGSGAITVSSPDGNATINTTGTNTVTLTGVLDSKTITTTGTGGSTVTPCSTFLAKI